jgi:hypothetical protein
MFADAVRLLRESPPGRFVLNPWTRYVIAWLLALTAAAWVIRDGWTYFDNDVRGAHRNDGNWGHTTIDFGGSWLMGRMLVVGEGPYLYDRNHLRNVARASFLRADQDPASPPESWDADNFLVWMTGADSAETQATFASCLTPLAASDGLSAAAIIAAARESAWTDSQIESAGAHVCGGHLYPPINAVYSAPFALVRPQMAYRIHQVLDVLLMLLAALGATRLAPGRLWFPVALAALVLFPGVCSGYLLGQNAILSVTILVWGWVLIARDRPVWGGAVWGLLSYKPVWAVSFFAVLLLSRRWRGALAMAVTATCLIALTLPLVGLHSWQDWFAVGQEGAEWHKVAPNWIRLSRDLLGIPRRHMIDFKEPWGERDRPEAALAGWSLLLSVWGLTAMLALWQPRRAREVTGTGAAFLLLGGFLGCFHFMYYDVALAYVPVIALLVGPRHALHLDRPLTIAGPFDWLRGFCVGMDLVTLLTIGTPLLVLVAMPLIEHALPRLELTDDSTPLDTYVLIYVWFACAWAVYRRQELPARGEEAGPEAEVDVEVAALPDDLGLASEPIGLPARAVVTQGRSGSKS